MADTGDITKKIILELENKGFTASAKEIVDLRKQIQELVKENENLKKITSKLVKEQVAGKKELSKRQKDEIKLIEQTVNVYKKYEGQVVGVMKKLAMGIIPFQSIDVLKKYNLLLIKSSSASLQFGISMTKLTNNFKDMQKSLKLTKTEVLELWDAYTKKMPDISLGGHKKLMENIKQVTGSDKEAMAEMFNTLTGIIDKYPYLQSAMENLDDSSKERLKNALAMGQHRKEFDKEQIRAINKLIGGGKQLSKEDKKKNDELQKQVESFQKFKIHAEKIALTLGAALAPALEKISQLFEDNKKKIQTLFGWIEKVISFVVKHPLISLGLAGGLKIGVTGLGMKAASMASGVGASAAGGAVAGGIGKVLGSAASALVAHPAILAAIITATAAIAGTLWINKKMKEAEGFENQTDRMKFMMEHSPTQGEGRTEASFKEAYIKKYGLPAANVFFAKRRDQEKANLAKRAAGKKSEATPEGELEKAQRRLDAISEVIQSGTQNIDTLMKQMQITGNIDINKLMGEQQKTVTNLNKEFEYTQILLNDAKDTLVKQQVILNDENSTLEQIKAAEQELVSSQDQINKYEAIGLGITEKIYNVNKSLTDVLQTKVKLAQIDSDLAHAMVQLADNYAISVGASVKLRMQAYQADQAHLNTLKQELASIQARMAQYGRGDALLAEEKQKHLEILNIQQKMASTVKSVRDGWVSAISAMNTGAGTFSKIVFTQTENTAGALRAAKGAMELSRVSGAFEGGRRSSRLSAGGDYTNRGLSQVAYETSYDKKIGGIGGVGAIAQGQRASFMEQAGKQLERGAELSTRKGRTGTGGELYGAPSGGYMQGALIAGGQKIDLTIRLSEGLEAEFDNRNTKRMIELIESK